LVANLETLVSSSLVVSGGASQRTATPANKHTGPGYGNARTDRKSPQSGCWLQPIVRYCVQLFFALVGLWPFAAQNPPRFCALRAYPLIALMLIFGSLVMLIRPHRSVRLEVCLDIKWTAPHP
jgi:hypothetical protein